MNIIYQCYFDFAPLRNSPQPDVESYLMGLTAEEENITFCLYSNLIHDYEMVKYYVFNPDTEGFIRRMKNRHFTMAKKYIFESLIEELRDFNYIGKFVRLEI